MAKKTTTSSSKSPARSKGKTRKPRTGSTSTRRRSTRKTGAKQTTAPKKSTQTKPPIREGLSLDRKLDIVGVVLTLIGVLTFLSYISATNSSLTGGWASILAQVFGVGMYLFPFGLIGVGLWLVLRNFERVPQLSFERILGFILLFANILAFIHFFNMLQSERSALELAQAGEAGGYVGAAGAGLLDAALGKGGTAIALFAWLLIALALSLDITVVDMVSWIPNTYSRLQDWVIETWEEYRPKRKHQVGASTYPNYSQLPAEGEAGSVQPDAPITVGESYAIAPQSWALPPLEEILDSGGEVAYDDEVDLQRAHLIEETLSSFGAPARVVEINRGPTITQFGVEPDYLEFAGWAHARARQ